jgi:hypothetical protein
VIFFVFPKEARGFAVVLSQSRYRNMERIDLREHYEARPGDPDTLRPTRKGVSMPVNQLPALRAALQEAEIELLERGVLRVQHYERAGLPVPGIFHKECEEDETVERIEG